jgi:hypothetical protein
VGRGRRQAALWKLLQTLNIAGNESLLSSIAGRDPAAVDESYGQGTPLHPALPREN